MATVTIGAETYTVYSDVTTADIYFNGSVSFAEWDTLTTDEKSRGLISATRLIDRQSWQGERAVTSPDEGLDFPRTGLTDCSGSDVTEAESLAAAVEASQLLALDVNSDTSIIDNTTTEDLTKRLKAGPVEIENFRANIGTSTRFPLDVMELIGCFLASNVAISGSIATGTDGTALDDDFSIDV